MILQSNRAHSIILTDILAMAHRDVREVGRDTLEPIMYLLQSHDVEVQRAASAALGNLAVNSESSRVSKSSQAMF